MEPGRFLLWLAVGGFCSRTVTAFAGNGIELAGSVPGRGVGLCGCETFSFHGLDMQDFRPCHVLDVAQCFHESGDVVAVDRPEIAHVEPLEDILLARQERLQRVVEAHDASAARLRYETEFFEEFERLEPQAVVSFRRCHARQIPVHRPHVLVNRPVVVVQYDEQVVGCACGVVYPLEGESSGYRGVADYGGDYAARIVAVEFRCHGHAQSRRNRVRRMSGREGIVGTFVRVGETAEAVELAVAGETVAAPGEQFVTVCLVADIPHDEVVWGVKHVVQCHGKFHSSHA